MSIAPACGSHPVTEPGASLPRFGLRSGLGVFVAFFLLGLVYTAPLLLHLADALPFTAVPPQGRERLWRTEGDYLQFYYYLWLVRDRLLSGASFHRDPYQFAVDGPRLNLPNTFLPFALLFLPLSAAGPRLGYNLLVLLSFPFAGLAATLLAHRYGLDRWAATVAGAVFACAPYRVGALLGGHPAGLAYFLVPLAVWGLEGALAGALGGAAWCAVGLVSLAIVEPHFFYFAALGLPLYLLARAGPATLDPATLRVGGATWAVALAVAAAPAWGVLAALERDGWDATPAARVALGLGVGLGVLGLWQCTAGWLRAAGSAADGRAAARRSLLAYLPWLGTAAAPVLGRPWLVLLVALPVVVHVAWLAPAWPRRRRRLAPLALVGVGAGAGVGFLLLLRRLLLTRSVSGAGRSLHEVLLFSPEPGDLLVRANPFSHRAIYLGLLPVALALAGGLAAWLGWPGARRRILLVFAPLLVLSAALSLGPRLPGLPLFEAFFYRVPFWNFIRQPAKLQVLASLALAILAASGTAALAGRLGAGWRRAALAVLVALLVAAEYHPWRPTGLSLLPTGGAAYAAIRATGPRALYLPLWPGDSAFSALYLYSTTLTRVPMLNGYSAWIDRRYVTDVYGALQALNVGAVGEAEYAALRRHGVQQVVLDRDAFPLKVSPFGPAFTLAGLERSPFLDRVSAPGQEHALWVFRVREGPGAARGGAPRSPLGIHWEAESLARETGQVTADPEASNGRVVVARAGRDRPGFVTFGPYRLLPAGPFRATFRLRGEATEAEVQVTAAGGRRVLGMRPARPAGGPLEEVAVPFTLDAPAAVEYRVKWDGRGWIAVDAVAAAFADVPDPAPAFEVEALGHELAERADPGASGGLVAYADPERAPRGRVWQGPFRAYPAGRYRLWVRLKLDRPIAGAFAWCGAQAASLGPMAGGRELAGGEVPAPGQWVELAVPFVLARPTVLEFPCLYGGRVGVSFDRLRIEGPLAAG